MELQRLNPLKKSEEPPVPSVRRVSPEGGATPLSLLYFAWLGPLMKTGYKRPLEQNDIWLVANNRAATVLHEQLRTAFLARVHAKSRFPLAMAIYDTSTFDFRLSAACQLLTAILQVTAPFTLQYLLRYSQAAYAAKNGGGQAPAMGVGVGYALGITAMLAIQNFSLAHFYYRGMLMGGKTRGALIALVFEKSLRLSRRAKVGKHPGKSIADDGTPIRVDTNGWSNGRIMALISTDAKRIERGCEMFHLVWTSPLQVCLTIALLIVTIGVSSLAGVAVLVFGLIAITHTTGFLIRSRAAINAFTDQRASLTHEMLHAVRFIKVFAWEKSFLDRLMSIRATEARALRTMHFIKSGLEACSMAIPIFSNMIAIIVYSATGHKLEASSVFAVVALINGLRTPMNWFPQSIGYVADALSAMKRIEDFLLAEEVPARIAPTTGMEAAIHLEHATFTWELAQEDGENEQAKSKGLVSKWRNEKRTKTASVEPQESDNENDTTPGERTAFQLEDISISIRRGELVAVVGNVGSGKTSLLDALASEMRQTGGIYEFCDYRAYCPQQAWIQNSSVRDNVIFGKPFDPDLYARVVRACALLPDFEALPDGDMTEIGEKGITLSGGQKQRINVARAIYSGATIVLLDDPLSAVDANVGAHIFNEAICGLLRGKCRVMATHQLHTLARCDKIVRMVDGRIAAIGTYEQLLSKDAAFSKQIAVAGLGDTASSKSSNVETEVRDTMEERTGDAQPLMQADLKAVDSVSWAVLIVWTRASGGILNMLWMLLTQVFFRSANILTNVWISWWVANRFGLSRGQYAGIYAALAFIQGILLFIFSAVTVIVGTKASQTMSNEAMWRILRAPMTFFDTTPLGRIMHRFTADIDATDNTTTDALRQFLICLTSLLATVLLTVVYFYYFIIAIAAGTVALCFAVNYYRSSARELKRLHSLLDGVVFARFGEALVGASCIEAYGRAQDFTDSLYRAIDDMNGAYFLTFANQRWLSIRLDSLGTILLFVTAILVASNSLSVSPSNAGLVMSYSFSISGMIQITIKYLTQLDNALTSTERLHQYSTDVAVEGVQEKTVQVEPAWPEYGRIEYREVKMRYRPDSPLVIDGFTLDIGGGERIGIVGRTGAGKSTILTTLFRITELAGGRIYIDGVDISEVSLHDLRARLAIIPQDPTLFRGDIRSNLDPEAKYTDLELCSALRQSHLLPDDTNVKDLKTPPHRPQIGLDDPVEEDGLNYSLGQRQLLALARALLRDSRIVLVDEGTSSVDPETDACIQTTLAKGLKGKTLIAIAHRLRTVLLYDRVCVMEHGVIVELGPPFSLWESGGIFRQMCDRNGIVRGDFDHR